MRKVIGAVLVAGLLVAGHAQAGEKPYRASKPVGTYVLEVQYLALVTPAGTTVPASMAEYEVRVESISGLMTEEEAETRALYIGQAGVVVGQPGNRTAIPAHRVQSVMISSLSVRGGR